MGKGVCHAVSFLVKALRANKMIFNVFILLDLKPDGLSEYLQSKVKHLCKKILISKPQTKAFFVHRTKISVKQSISSGNYFPIGDQQNPINFSFLVNVSYPLTDQNDILYPFFTLIYFGFRPAFLRASESNHSI